MKQRTYYALPLAIIAIALISNLLYAQQVDLGSIQKHHPIRYISIGGSLSAGVMNGGIDMESQLSSFPNLLARQMGVDSFSLPLFEGSFKNGTGQMTATAEGGMLIRKVSSESAFGEDEQLPKINRRIDNLAVPYLKVRELTTRENEPGAFLPNFNKESYRHLNRYIDAGKEGNSSYISVLKDRLADVDFFTWELGADDFTEYFFKGGCGAPVSFVTSEREGNFPENEILKELVARGAKGVIANVPEVLAFPIYHFYNSKNLTDNSGESVYIRRYAGNDVRTLEPRDLLLPTENVSNLFAHSGNIGRSKENPLPDEHVVGHEELVTVGWYNQLISGFAKENNLALVDLHSLYERILRGEYISHDGVRIDPAYPGGNFFSADGIHPGRVGQAVIANEFIRTINAGYGSQVPLIAIKSIR